MNGSNKENTLYSNTGDGSHAICALKISVWSVTGKWGVGLEAWRTIWRLLYSSR